MTLTGKDEKQLLHGVLSIAECIISRTVTCLQRYGKTKQENGKNNKKKLVSDEKKRQENRHRKEVHVGKKV